MNKTNNKTSIIHGDDGIKPINYITFILLILVFAITLLASTPLNAGTIYIAQTSTARVADNTIFIETVISNQGDTAAFNLIPRVVVAGKNTLLPSLPRLNPRESYSKTISVKLGSSPEWNHNILTTTEYQNENGKLFESTSILNVNSGSIYSSPVSFSLQPVKLNQFESAHSLQLINSAKETTSVNLLAVFPRGVGASFINKSISIKGLSELSIPIILNSTNFEKFDGRKFYIAIAFSSNSKSFSYVVPSLLYENNNLLADFFSNTKIVQGLSVLLLIALLFIIIKNVVIYFKRQPK